MERPSSHTSSNVRTLRGTSLISYLVTFLHDAKHKKMTHQWPKKWLDLPLAVFDTETTGKDPSTCRLLEIGIVHFEHGEVVKTFNWMVNPECEIPEDVVRITGITQDDVKNEKPFAAIAKDVLAAFEGHALVAYNMRYDRTVLTRYFEECGLKWPDDHPTIDPLVFANYFYKNERHNNLGSVCERLGVSLEGAHRACNDAEATGKVLYAFNEHFELPPDLESLLIVQTQWERENLQRQYWRKNDQNEIGLNEISTISNDLNIGFIYGKETDPLKALYMAVPNVQLPRSTDNH